MQPLELQLCQLAELDLRKSYPEMPSGIYFLGVDLLQISKSLLAQCRFKLLQNIFVSYCSAHNALSITFLEAKLDKEP